MHRNAVAFSRLLPTLLVTSAAFFVQLSPAPFAMEFPRQGRPDIPNGVAEPFSGLWWIGFPEGKGIINGAPVVDCSAAVELVPQDGGTLLYRSSSGSQVQFELLEFGGRTTWLPENGESIIAVWINVDEFFAYSVDLGTGSARWDNPLVYRRC